MKCTCDSSSMKVKIYAVIAATIVVAVVVFTPTRGVAQSLSLDPLSSSLPGIPATSSSILRPAAAPAPGPLAAPVVGQSAAALGLLPGDVIDAISYGDDAPMFAGALHFSVSRSSISAGPTPVPPDVFTEVLGVPPLTQTEAAGDMFTAFDPACPPTPHTQILDGNGLLLGPPACYGGFGQGLAELLPTPPVTFNDDLIGFDWGAPGKTALGCVFFSLAGGSPTLTPGANPLLLAGAQPADIMVACPGPPIFLGVAFPAAAHALTSGVPAAGCAPPVCDDMDALSLSFGGGTIMFSLAPGSPTLTGFGLSAADVFGGALFFGGLPPAPVVAPAAFLGLAGPVDNIDALESTVNGCPVPAPGDVPDFDGLGACDNCPGSFNPGQEDSDFDLIGDACDLCTDSDGDGFGNPGFPANACATDLCPFTPSLNGDADADTIGDECDNCPLLANAGQVNIDFDADGDACDLCPHVGGGVPVPFDVGSLKKASLGFKNNGPGTGDDSAKTGAAFTTAVPFDPDTTDTVYATLTNTVTSAVLSSTTMTAGLPWTQPNPAKLAWKYSTAVAPLVKASIKEAPAASMTYKWKVGVKTTNLPGPQISPATDDIRVTLEIMPMGLCLNGTLPTCTSTPLKKDSCKP